jgi:hypothetical protein
LPGIDVTGNGPLITGVPKWESVWPNPDEDSGESPKGPWEKITGHLNENLNSALGGLTGGDK